MKFLCVCALIIGFVFVPFWFSMRVFSIFFPPIVTQAFLEIGPAEHISIRFVFTKPIQRRELRYSVSPVVVGEWKLEAPTAKNHLFQEVVFLPAANLKEGIVYNIDVSGIQGFLGKTASSYKGDSAISLKARQEEAGHFS